MTLLKNQADYVLHAGTSIGCWFPVRQAGMLIDQLYLHQLRFAWEQDDYAGLPAIGQKLGPCIVTFRHILTYSQSSIFFLQDWS